jgi:hypothetical protein
VEEENLLSGQKREEIGGNLGQKESPDLNCRNIKSVWSCLPYLMLRIIESFCLEILSKEFYSRCCPYPLKIIFIFSCSGKTEQREECQGSK